MSEKLTLSRNKAKTNLKRKKGRKNSSQRWLQRQLNDPYVHEARKKGYRSRAAFKLLQLNEKFHFLKTGQKVLDLGAAPGGWTQIAANAVAPQGKVVGIDILEMEPIAGAVNLQGDIYDEGVLDTLIQELGSKADLVLSDMAANTIGHAATDNLRTIALAEAAADVAIHTLKESGTFVGKVFQGGANKGLLDLLNAHFEKVKHFKPPASRKGSPETYVVAMGFKA